MHLFSCIFVEFNVYGFSLELVKNSTLSGTRDWLTSRLGLQHPQVDMWGAREDFQKSVTIVVTRK